MARIDARRRPIDPQPTPHLFLGGGGVAVGVGQNNTEESVGDPRPHHAPRPAHDEVARGGVHGVLRRAPLHGPAEQREINLLYVPPLGERLDIVGVLARLLFGNGSRAFRNHDDVGGESAHDPFDIECGVGVGRGGGSSVAHAASSILNRDPKSSFQTSLSSSAEAKCAASQALWAAVTISARSASVIRLATLLRLYTGSRMTTESSKEPNGAMFSGTWSFSLRPDWAM